MHPLGKAPPVALRLIDDAGALTADALELLREARQSAGRGIRAAGPEGDEQRAEVLAALIRADEALYEARLTLDRLLMDASLRDVGAPRPVIMLPA